MKSPNLPLLLALACMVVGCSSTSHKPCWLLSPIASSPDGKFFAIPAHVVNNGFEQDLGIAWVWHTNHVSPMLPCIGLYITYYRATSNGQIPENVLLVLRCGRLYQLELVDLDASKCILADTKENRDVIKGKLQENTFLPARKEWLSREAAIREVKKSLGMSTNEMARFTFSARREEFSWSVKIRRAGRKAPIGSEFYVIIGDDRTVRMIYPGM
jgi:hypothetical protein